MPDELENFQTTGLTWQERAKQYVGIDAVYSPKNHRLSRWLSLLSTNMLVKSLTGLKRSSVILDFGCGVGMHTQYIARNFSQAIGVDITMGMLEQALTKLSQSPATLSQIDGIHLPLPTSSIDAIWICGVLRYSLNVPVPKYKEVGRELFRVLKPGGALYNYEMYVTQPSCDFTAGFQEIGFNLVSHKTCNTHQSRFQSLALGKSSPLFLRPWWAKLSLGWISYTAREEQLGSEVRDYYLVYTK